MADREHPENRAIAAMFRGDSRAASHARFDARLIGRTEVIAIDEVRRLALAEAAETGLAALAVRSDEYA